MSARSVLAGLAFATALALPVAAGELPFQVAALASHPPDSAAGGISGAGRIDAFMPSEDGPLAAKWKAALRETDRDLAIVRGCLEQPASCAFAGAQEFAAIVAAARRKDGRARIGEINRAINLALRPGSDMTRHGVADRWSGPLDTFHAGEGDCEDYAIAKYAALRLLGFSPDDLRLVIVRLALAGQDHAVVWVRSEGRWLILDNRRMAMIDAAHDRTRTLHVMVEKSLAVTASAELQSVSVGGGSHSGDFPVLL